GRLSQEMFAMLQEKEYIMSNKTKIQRLKELQEQTLLKKSLINQQKQLGLNQKHRTFQPHNQKLPQAHKQEPFKSTVSRDNFYTLKSKMTLNNQKFLMYNPKFHLIFQKSPFYPNQEIEDRQRKNRENKYRTFLHAFQNEQKQQEKQKSQRLDERKKITQSITETSVLGIDFDKPYKKPVQPLDFSKITDRKPMKTEVNPHELRFEYIDYPEIYSKFKHLPNISFSKQIKQQSVIGSKTGGLDYNVNMESILKKQGQGILDYSKVSPRKWYDKNVYTLNEQTVDYFKYQFDENKSQILKKITVPYFDKMGDRYRQSHKNLTNTSKNSNIL
ncbi:hypothetical protein IMG5_142990, partial [Ichthyophthirius multifiliis]